MPDISKVLGDYNWIGQRSEYLTWRLGIITGLDTVQNIWTNTMLVKGAAGRNSNICLFIIGMGDLQVLSV